MQTLQFEPGWCVMRDRLARRRRSGFKAGFSSSILVTVLRGQADRAKADIERTEPLLAPTAKGQRLGTLHVKLDDKPLADHPLIALDEVEQAGFLGRSWDTLQLWFKR